MKIIRIVHACLCVCACTCESIDRSSPTKVCAMVDSLDAFKKSLVEEIEFGGILVVPLIPRMNLKLSIWLMSRVDEVSRTIYIRPGRQISFRASDVHKILGVP